MAEAGENLRGGVRLLRRPPSDGGGRPGVSAPVVNLRREAQFACGYHRDCFVHPEIDGRCIKVSRKDDNRETMREVGYYEHLERRDIPWDLLPRFHGFVETNLGWGAVFDLVRDADGEISKPLCDYLRSPDLTVKHRRGIIQGLQRLRRYLVDHRIIVRTIKPKNLVYQIVSPDEGRLLIVDNIGNTEALPLATHISYFALRKINRKWAQFENALLAEFHANPVVAGIVAEARDGISVAEERAG